MSEGGGERSPEFLQISSYGEILIFRWWFCKKETLLAIAEIEEGELKGCEVDGLVG